MKAHQPKDLSSAQAHTPDVSGVSASELVSVLPSQEPHGASLVSSASPSQEELAHLRKTLAQQEGRLQAVLEIGRALGSAQSLDQVLNLIMSRVTYVMDADRSTLFLLDEDRQELWSKVLQGSRVSEIRLRVGEGIAGWVARMGKSINIKDAYRDPRFNRNIDIASGYQTRSCLCQPLRNQERRIIGVIQVLNKRHGYFTVEDENLLSAIASQAAISVENSKLYLSVVAKNMELLEYKERLEQKMSELDLLLEIEHEVSTAASFDAILSAIGSRTLNLIDAEACSITLTARSGAPWMRGVRRVRGDDAASSVHEEALDAPGATARQAISSGEAAVTAPDPDGLPLPPGAEPAAAALGVQARSALAVPLIFEGQTLGCLEVFNRAGFTEDGAPLGFTDDDLKLASLIASALGHPISSQLQRDNREKADRLSAIGQMLASVLHDLKTPISIIRGYVQLMVRADDRERRQEFAGSVVQQFDILNSMTKEILAFARGETNILLLKVLIPKLMEDVEAMLSTETQDRNISALIDTRYRGAARIDEVKMRRLFANLIRNAIEAMPSGGRISITTERVDDQLRFSFSDTGGGIPEHIRGRLFESFVTSGKKNGTGLGLAIVKKIVDDHMGAISYESTPQVGTTFHILIPLGLDTNP
jgi:signal transduction histidine kinase/putative methionine-R-sulfoxide reductase with GAF domain